MVLFGFRENKKMGEKSGILERSNSKKKRSGGIKGIFMHADAVDILLMTLGFIGALGDGFTRPVVLLVNSRLMNSIGNTSRISASSPDMQVFIHSIEKKAVILLCIACATFVVCFLEGYCWTRTGERQTARMRARYLKAVLRQDVGFFDMHVTGTTEVITSVSSDTLVIQDVLSEKIPNFLMNMANFLGNYIVGFILLWQQTLVGLPFALLLLVPGLLYGRTSMGFAREIMEGYKKAGTVAEQAVSSIRTVYAYAGEDKIKSDYSSALEISVKLGLKQGLSKGLAIGSNGVSFAIWAFMAWYGSRMVMYHGAQGGTIFAIGAAIAVGGLSVGKSFSNIQYFSEAIEAGERIMEIINRVPKIDSDDMEGQILENVSGEVQFSNVQFAYPSRPETMILKDLTITIPAGRTVALVGGSGSGKSTVISLLQRFYDPLGGSILMDGVGIEKLQLKWLRSQMGLVSQEPALFATSIKENILFGKEDATMDEIVEAAKASNAHNFISLFPDGYDTQVGERGVQMSGGQKQRIAIARAIIKHPRILLLDEATSALDSESERVVQEALEKAAIGRTTIVIAHRLSTIRNADLIAVIQNGRVMETGSHNDLIQNQTGIYASLVHLQQTAAQQQSPNEPSASSIPHLANIRSNGSRRLSFLSPSSPTNSVGSTPVHETTVIEKRQNLPKPSFRRLLALNLPEWKQAIMGCISAMLFGAVQPVHSFLMGSMISVYFLTSHEEIKAKTRTYALGFFGLSIFTFLVNVCEHYNFAYMGEYLTKRIREMMLSKILTFEVGWFDQDENSSGAICTRLSQDANLVRSLVGDRIGLIMQTISAVVIAFTLGFILSWKLAFVIISVQPMTITSLYTRQVLLRRMSKNATKSQEQCSKLAAEAVSNLRTITAFSSQDHILKMLEKAQEVPTQQGIKKSWYAGIGLGCCQCITTCSLALNFWYGSKLISKGETTAKGLFQTFLILVSTGRVIADAGSMTSDLAKGSGVVSSVFDVLDRITKIEPDNPEGYKPDKLTGRIEFMNVDFFYPSRPEAMIFRGFSIKIEAGKSTALVGQSGSGKSTIIGLVERFYDPIKGTIQLDGRDLKSYHLRTLRKRIALVSQEPTLFAGTIRDNIVYGYSETADESEIIEAAKAANAHDFISGLKDGYETLCGDRGLQLSGGQKQRIAIARAILKNPTVLLLDEATSALDGQSEKLVQEALERVMVGRTSVVVAHRLSTIQNCDMIAVLDKGKVVETGNHSSLMGIGEKGAYYALVNLQSISH
ncbi:ABC transporter B family member 15, partial [Cucurbita argyrosperma subsp. sororia]